MIDVDDLVSAIRRDYFSMMPPDAQHHFNFLALDNPYDQVDLFLCIAHDLHIRIDPLFLERVSECVEDDWDEQLKPHTLKWIEKNKE